MSEDSSAWFKKELLALLPNMRAFAISLSSNTDQADDLVQDTVVKAWAHMGSFQRGTNLRAWLFTILRNTYFSEYRKRRREINEGEISGDRELSVLPGQQSHVDLQDFRRALATLPLDQREALVLVGAAGFSYEETASICGCAVGTIKSRVNRARVRLAGQLAITSSHEFGPEAVIESVIAQSRGNARRTSGSGR